MDLARKRIRYFETYEQREDAFNKDVGALIPPRHHGPGLFWEQFGRIWSKDNSRLSIPAAGFVTSNPRDCLAFGTPWQVLQAADLSGLCGRRSAAEGSVDSIVEQFGMSDNLHQPIRTLSGGETVKLALAKMALLAPARDRIVIASPFSWLSSDNRTFLEQLASICHDSSAALELLALTGEDNIDPIRESDLVEGTRRHGIRFSLSFRDVFIQLGASLPAFRARKTLARVAGSLGDLSSPCLFVGQNGQGKSLVAKVLSGAISCDGHVHIQAGDNTAPPRLLFQDIMVQTLSRPFTKLSAFSHRGNGIHPHRLFYQIRDRYHQVMEKIGGRLPDQESPHNSGDHTLLDIKIMLAAARLCGSPGILILDEPDWGLSRSTAIALVTTLIEVSHTMHIPVILISHKPWWRPLSGSLVHVSKSGLDKREGAVCRFTIDLHRGEVR